MNDVDGGCWCLTSAGVGVICLGWSPGQVMIEMPAVLTVQTHCVMLTHTATMNLTITTEPYELFCQKTDLKLIYYFAPFDLTFMYKRI